MKCKICGGTGTSNTCVNGTFKPCTFCDGTGEYEPFDLDVELDKLDNEPPTNEEWFCGLSTEEKAKVLCNVVPELAYENDGVWDEKKFVEWLKEKHE